MVRIRRFHCRGLGSIPGQGNEIPQAVQCGQKEKSNGQDVRRPLLVNYKACHFKRHLLQLSSPIIRTLEQFHGSNTHTYRDNGVITFKL